jgi:hypothetical protein
MRSLASLSDGNISRSEHRADLQAVESCLNCSVEETKTMVTNAIEVTYPFLRSLISHDRNSNSTLTDAKKRFLNLKLDINLSRNRLQTIA